MEILGVKPRDLKLRRGDTLRETYEFFEDDEATLVDVSAWTFAVIIHKLGDESIVRATLAVSSLATNKREAFLSNAASLALPSPSTEPIVEFYARYTTPGGDVKTFDTGRIFLVGP
jgi:hypothetical protein